MLPQAARLSTMDRERSSAKNFFIFIGDSFHIWTVDQRRPIWGGNCVSRHGLHRAFDQTSGFLIVDVDLVLVDDGPDLPVQIVGDLTDLLGQEFIVPAFKVVMVSEPAGWLA